MTSHGRDAADRARALARHGAGFVASGLIALAVDALVLTILTNVLGLHPLVARLVAISCAMVVGWRAHRRLTFDVKHPPSLAEFLSYAAVAWFSAAVNYAGFAAVLLLRPATPPLVALVVGSLGAMTISYLGMRFGVFQDPAES